MDSKKKVLIGCGIAFVVLIILIIPMIIFGPFVYRSLYVLFMSYTKLDMPSELKIPRVLMGPNFLSKSIFFEDVRLGRITDIIRGEMDPNTGPEIGIAGNEAAVILDDSLKVISSIVFSAKVSHIEFVDIDGDGVCEFMNRGEWCCDAGLFDHRGNLIWQYSETPGVDDMAAGDIDGDGKLKFAVGLNGDGGVILLDGYGKRIWREEDGNVWHIEMVDTNGDGNLEIVHSNVEGMMVIRKRDGRIIRKIKTEIYFSKFSLSRWPARSDHEYAMVPEENAIWLLDFDGKTVVKYRAPICSKWSDARGTPVRLKNGEPEYFAVIMSFITWERSVLYVYNPDRSLVYQEILPEACASITTLSKDDSTKDVLLVGCKGRVFEYKVP